MITMLVGRCHVGDTNREVVAYVLSCLRPGAWERMAAADRFCLMRETIRAHKENRELYRKVMGGHF